MQYLSDRYCIFYQPLFFAHSLFNSLGIIKANDMMRPGSGRPGTAGDRGLISSGIGGTSYHGGGGKDALTNFV